MLSFAKYFCTLSICNLLLLHGILSAPTDSEESVLEEKQRCQSGYCWNSYQNQCRPCGGGGGGGHNCPYGQYWNGNQCVSSGGGGGGGHNCPYGQYWNGYHCVSSGGGNGK